LLEIISAASEFDSLPVRPGEEVLVERLLAHAPVAVDKPKYTDPHTKANALLQVRRGGGAGAPAAAASRQGAGSSLPTTATSPEAPLTPPC
jgi:hypothetical protein